MCFLSLGADRFLKCLSCSPGQDVCIPVCFSYTDGSSPASEGIWNGEKGKDVGKIHIVLPSADLLMRF